MIYMMNNRESKYENTIRMTFYTLRAKNISWIPKTFCIINIYFSYKSRNLQNILVLYNPCQKIKYPII
jgi:hypothetical protein